MHGLEVHFTQRSTQVISNAPSSAVPWLRWFLIPLAMVPLLFWLEQSFDLAISAFFLTFQAHHFRGANNGLLRVLFIDLGACLRR